MAGNASIGGSGQASIEVIGAVPLLLFFSLVCFQLLAVGYGAVMADNAAEAAALAKVNGGDAVGAAQRSVPGWPARSITVKQHGERVEVTLHPPSPLPILRNRLALSASAIAREPKANAT